MWSGALAVRGGSRSDAPPNEHHCGSRIPAGASHSPTSPFGVHGPAAEPRVLVHAAAGSDAFGARSEARAAGDPM